MAEWRLIRSGGRSPSYNMALDAAVRRGAAAGSVPPTVRFYAWDPPSVSIGYNQSPEKVVDTPFCRARGIPIVRRPTGGSAILHDVEITYSVAAPLDAHPAFAMPLSSYLAVCRAIRRGLAAAGAAVEIRGFSEGREPSYTARACFALLSRHDLVIGERKVVGSAQVRDSRSFLQHGSVLLDIRRDLWEGVFRERVDFDRVGSLAGVLPAGMGGDRLEELLAEGFAAEFGVALVQGEPTSGEGAEASETAGGPFDTL